MTEPHNPRGYAYTAFATTYTRQLSYNVMAAALRYGYYPTLPEYITQGLRLFDRMWATATHDDDTLRVTVDSIVKDMGQSIRADVIGHFKYTGGHGQPQWISTKHDVTLDAPISDENDDTIASLLGDHEDGYDKVLDDDLMMQRLRLVAERMSPEDMAILEAYIDGASFVEACRAKGVHPDTFTKRMRWQCKSLIDAEVFV